MKDAIASVARKLAFSKHAIALSGAGISTESGVPDFRGPQGVWTKNPAAERNAYRSYERFLEHPAEWWQERLTVPSVLGDLNSVLPNAGHYALAELEELAILKCVITQNVDGLHEKAGTLHVIDYHGSLFKYRCVDCGKRFGQDKINIAELQRTGKLPPRCASCGGAVKTDGVSFGEPIPADVAGESVDQARRCDVMLICGTSAVVYPFASLPRIARSRQGVTIVEINAEPTPLTREGVSDVLVQGKTGDVLPRLVSAVREVIREDRND